MTSRAARYRPTFLLAEGRLQSGATLAVGADGRVVDEAALPPDVPVVSLPGKALLPGLVNAHSHAFQRLIRGRTEFVPRGVGGDDFWAWRERMYRVAAALGPDGLFIAARQAFVEMALAGITSVGEFHYLHRAPDGRPYDESDAMAWALVRAAREVGLRLVVLRGLYARAGHRRELHPVQRRFVEPSVEESLARAGALAQALRGDPEVSVGVAPHSVRALPRAWLEGVRRGAGDGPVHIHLAEQPREVEECRAEHGLRPAELLEEVGLLGPTLTAVHAIHVTEDEVALLGRSKVGVCACPSTERNLGDGVVPADALARAGCTLALGSDSQASIDLLDEARQLEGHLRLVRQRRAVLDPGAGDPGALSLALLATASAGGARCLGIQAGRLAPGEWADFFTVDLAHPSLAGVDPGSFVPALVLVGGASVVNDVAVGGRFVVRDGDHARTEESGRAFTRLAAEVFA